MISKGHSKTLLIVGICFLFNSIYASDAAKEKRWADEIVDSIMVGNAEWLTVGNSKILSIFTEHTTAKAIGGAIVLHGSGVHPNWDQIIRPLRSQLPDHGWSTLSLQLPVLANEAQSEDYIPLFEEVTPRIKAGVDFLKAKGIQNIVIIAHSLGSVMSAYYMANKPDPAIRAFVVIGAPGELYKSEKGEKVNFLTSLKTIKVPVLDIFGSNDLDSVLKSEKNKTDVARKSGNTNYTQVKIVGANHFFDNKDADLVKRVRGWLAKNAEGTELKR
jgi:pimeloyl-ACP methyl ester carboxylesterase